MRSQQDYIVTKNEVHGYANDWLARSLKLEYEGTKCTASTLFEILLIAAARMTSVFAVCRDLADAPCDQTIRNALDSSLPDISELERRLNRSLVTELPKALFRKRRRIAVDLTLIPYHGQPLEHEKEIYRSAPKSGTTHFHAYATVAVVHKGHRYTLALTPVEHGEKLKAVLQRLLVIVRRRQVKIRFLLLDKEFFNVEVMSYLKRAGHGFIIPAVVRGRKPKRGKQATGLRAIQKKKNGYYRYRHQGKIDGKTRRTQLTICVASKRYTHKKSGKRRTKKLMYAVWKVRLTPKQIRETYRTRFGIETSYRQMNEARIKTCTRDPALRLLFVGIALVLRNVWVWLHFKMAKGKWSDQPQLFLKLLRFREMLLWISQVVGKHLGADRKQGIEYEAYQRLTENY
ncbi:ISH3 family transposase [Bythopirellula polymerisocia]|uniref:Transposase DDE domain protein n=1 Tax=Bythopirellula polymerisocia TaxID=2528003 RepID=A0A5C6CCY4_9BACT|nr:ISH3 family transposase [Bythopirellula polymerisocia]TWU21351.1 Transposase DDE domain protein [Bythopirellula polymerisocia]